MSTGCMMLFWMQRSNSKATEEREIGELKMESDI
jgi:hypothetical protein